MHRQPCTTILFHIQPSTAIVLFFFSIRIRIIIKIGIASSIHILELIGTNNSIAASISILTVGLVLLFAIRLLLVSILIFTSIWLSVCLFVLRFYQYSHIDIAIHIDIKIIIVISTGMALRIVIHINS